MKSLLNSTLLILGFSAVLHICHSVDPEVSPTTEPIPAMGLSTAITEDNSSLSSILPRENSTVTSNPNATETERDNNTKGNKTAVPQASPTVILTTVNNNGTLVSAVLSSGTKATIEAMSTSISSSVGDGTTVSINVSTGMKESATSESTLSSFTKGVTSTQGNNRSTLSIITDEPTIKDETSLSPVASKSPASESIYNISSTEVNLSTKEEKKSSTTPLTTERDGPTATPPVSTGGEDQFTTPPVSSVQSLDTSPATFKPAVSSHPDSDITASSATRAHSTEEAGTGVHVGGSTVLKVALGISIPIAIIALIVGFLILRKKCKKKGRGYQTLDDFGIGNYDGLNNPNYGADLDL